MDFEFISIIIVSIIMGLITMFIGKAKGFNGFLYGFALGIIGIIIVLCKSSEKEIISNTKNELQTKNTEDKYGNLEKLYELKNNGTLSSEEYEKEKNKILNL